MIHCSNSSRKNSFPRNSYCIYLKFVLYYWTEYISSQKFKKNKPGSISARILKSLRGFITSFCDHFDKFEAKTETKTEEKTDKDYQVSRIQKRNIILGENPDQTATTRRNKFLIETFLKIIDTRCGHQQEMFIMISMKNLKCSTTYLN